MSPFAARLKELRKANNKLQREMAELLGVTERHYRLCEAGKVDIPTSKLIALADYFDVSLDYLTGRSDDPNSHKI
jgi:transcriptional regulator with XRE-family HTH domain